MAYTACPADSASRPESRLADIALSGRPESHLGQRCVSRLAGFASRPTSRPADMRVSTGRNSVPAKSASGRRWLSASRSRVRPKLYMSASRSRVLVEVDPAEVEEMSVGLSERK